MEAAEKRPLGKAEAVIITPLPQKQRFASKAPFVSFKMKAAFTLSYFVSLATHKQDKKGEWGGKETMKITDAGGRARGIFLFQENEYNPGMQDSENARGHWWVSQAEGAGKKNERAREGKGWG